MKHNNPKQAHTSIQILTLLISAAVIVVAVWAARNSSRTASQQKAKSASVQKLETLRQKYAKLKSVHIVAEAVITLYGANSRSGSGLYEYWGTGDRYRMKVHTDGRLGLLGDREVAYDGKRFFFFDKASKILSYQKQDIPKSTGAIPNPLFMPVDFLSLEDDACQGCAIRLIDFKSSSEKWEHRAARMEVKSSRRDERTGQDVTDLEMPGGMQGKRPFKIRVRVADTPQGPSRISQIDRIGDEGTLRSSYSFDQFIPSDLGDFPTKITLEGFDGDGNLQARMVFTIKLLETNQPLNDHDFAIDFDQAPGVWDSDERRFVKEKPVVPRVK